MSEFHSILALVGFVVLACLGVWHFFIFPFFIVAQVERVETLSKEIKIGLAELADEMSAMFDDEGDES